MVLVLFVTRGFGVVDAASEEPQSREEKIEDGCTKQLVSKLSTGG